LQTPDGTEAMSNDSAEPVLPRSNQPVRWLRLRRWLPIGVIALEALGLGVTQYLENAELVPPAEAGLTKRSMVALGTLLIFLWFVFLSFAPARLRRSTGIVGLLIVLAVVAMVRIDGVTGDIGLHLNWRWAPRPDQTLPSASQLTTSANVDLTQTAPDDSPQFMGPHRTAVYSSVLATDWSAHPPKLLWRHPVGAGWSSFAIVDHFGVTQEQRGDEELITCYDLNDGTLQWAHATPVRFHEILAGVGPRATPTIDEGRVYALGALGHLHCLDGATGKVIWQHDVVTETGAVPPQWGKSCSPLIYGNLVIVCAGASGGKSLVAYDKLDGKLVWSAGDDSSGYSSPTIMTLCDVPQIVMGSAQQVSGHDPETGRILWQHEWPDGGSESPNVSQPVAVGQDQILLTRGYGIGCALWQIKLDGDRWSVEPLWKNNNLKTKMTSAVVTGGHAYGLDEGTLCCLELSSGKKLWKRGRYGHGQVLLAGNVLLVQSEDGEIALVEVSPRKFTELARMHAIEGQSWNYPVLWGNKLVIRTEKEMACYALPADSPSEEVAASR
jgi:outer membrane protein assembly factor BamB